MTKPSLHLAFQKYVSAVGGRQQAADRLGISLSMVGHILVNRRKISIEHAKLIETDTAGAITRHDLRPDVFGVMAVDTRSAQQVA